jgi:hypothetical protein
MLVYWPFTSSLPKIFSTVTVAFRRDITARALFYQTVQIFRPGVGTWQRDDAHSLE